MRAGEWLFKETAEFCIFNALKIDKNYIEKGNLSLVIYTYGGINFSNDFFMHSHFENHFQIQIGYFSSEIQLLSNPPATLAN